MNSLKRLLPEMTYNSFSIFLMLPVMVQMAYYAAHSQTLLTIARMALSVQQREQLAAFLRAQ